MFLFKKYKEISRLNSISDEQLINLFIAEDNFDAFGELFKRYNHLVYGLCLNYFKNTDEAYDMVMDIFEKLLSDIKKHVPKSFKSWLYTFSKNACLMHIRHQKVVERYIEYIKNNGRVFMDYELSDHHDNNNNEIQLLLQALEGLKEGQRNCLKRFYFENESYEDIALAEGYTLKQVKSYIQNGKRKLKIAYEKTR